MAPALGAGYRWFESIHPDYDPHRYGEGFSIPPYCAIIIKEMKKPFLLLLLAFVLLSSAQSAVFPGYDFTFAKTNPAKESTEESDTIISFDYTGYGYLGRNMNTGIYLRAGIEAPLASIMSIISREESSSEDIERYLEQSFVFDFALGPSFRKFIGDDAIWYMGMGASSELGYTGRSMSTSMTKHISLSVALGVEADMGIRIDVSENTTMRIGARAEYTLVILNIEKEQQQDGSESPRSTISLIPNMFLPLKEKEKMQAYGYISLGHTFRSDSSKGVYSYIITEPEPFRGTLLPYFKDADRKSQHR